MGNNYNTCNAQLKRRNRQPILGKEMVGGLYLWTANWNVKYNKGNFGEVCNDNCCR